MNIILKYIRIYNALYVNNLLNMTSDNTIRNNQIMTMKI